MREKESISIRKSLVVLVTDDFTGEPVDGDKVTVSIAGQRTPLVKPGGYRIFVNLPAVTYTLVCRSRIYYHWEAPVDVAERDPEEYLVIRLKPNAAYPFSRDVTCVAGKTAPLQRLWFWRRDSVDLRLLKDYKSRGEGCRNTIEIYHPGGRSLAGRCFFIGGTGEEEREYFSIMGGGEGRYYMDRELSRDYRKSHTVIQPVYEVSADVRGEFFLPLPVDHYQIPGEEIRITCQVEGKEKEKIFTIRTGRINPIIC